MYKYLYIYICRYFCCSCYFVLNINFHLKVGAQQTRFFFTHDFHKNRCSELANRQVKAAKLGDVLRLTVMWRTTWRVERLVKCQRFLRPKKQQGCITYNYQLVRTVCSGLLEKTISDFYVHHFPCRMDAESLQVSKNNCPNAPLDRYFVCVTFLMLLDRIQIRT